MNLKNQRTSFFVLSFVGLPDISRKSKTSYVLFHVFAAMDMMLRNAR